MYLTIRLLFSLSLSIYLSPIHIPVLTPDYFVQTNRTCPICRGDASNYFQEMSDQADSLRLLDTQPPPPGKSRNHLGNSLHILDTPPSTSKLKFNVDIVVNFASGSRRHCLHLQPTDSLDNDGLFCLEAIENLINLNDSLSFPINLSYLFIPFSSRLYCNAKLNSFGSVHFETQMDLWCFCKRKKRNSSCLLKKLILSVGLLSICALWCFKMNTPVTGHQLLVADKNHFSYMLC